jgi:ZIP family zinc transporter
MIVTVAMDPMELELALILALGAGATIPLGGLAARWEMTGSIMLGAVSQHSVIAFGGGVLFAAVALVLVPEGARHLSTVPALLMFGAGGLAFFSIDRAIELSGRSTAQLLAMVMDFLPESLALGAILSANRAGAFLLAFLIALQNLPEGFNAFRELRSSGVGRGSTLILAFSAIALLGPLMAWLGFAYLRDREALLGAIMLFAAGGILYLTFQDIAPQAKLNLAWAPALGAVGGFMLGLVGYLTIN